ncbi:unnamed protein product [Mytilus coruscus]|uniref:Uncharacterized protein n=1 Tax=Mytilus coruscus TaxID=42192 RepID=A0A6J8DTD0_MYTCO|nr:unnamed protein product [Mytilus coruscus]
MMKIHSSTGIVLAIGTPICSNCRKHLSSGKPDEHLEVSVPSEEIPVEPLSESVFSAHKPEKSSTLDETALILKDTYNTAETWTLRRKFFQFYPEITALMRSESLAPSSLVNQYIQFCDSENVGHLDHCQMFALCDSEKCFSQSCNTQHKHSCEQCIDLADFLAEISTLTQNGTWDNKDSIVFQVENAVEAIKDWKSHAMRARESRRCKTRSISQDGSVTASVLCDVVHDLTKQVPNIQKVNFFSDNAGCYKNTMMMVALRAELGDKLKTYNFSEAQDGKGPCDRRASHIKACVRRYINEGHDVTSAEEMKQEKFDIGKVSGRKVDPFQAADEMRQLQEEGKYVFSRKDYLTGQQITAYFSRLALKDRKTDLEDFRSAQEKLTKMP